MEIPSRLERPSAILFNMHYLSQKKINYRIVNTKNENVMVFFGLARVSIQNRT